MKTDRDIWKLLDLLKTAEHFLEEKGIENSRGNAEALLGKALNMPRLELYLHFDRPLSPVEVQAFRDLIKRRLNREPLQMILGRVEFCDVNIEVEPGLLVPRPETEEMTADVIGKLSAIHSDVVRVLDIGCGSGCISVALASADARIRVNAMDIDERAISATKKNAIGNAVGGRVRAIKADIFSDADLKKLELPFDIVISNPPYITEEDHVELQPEVRDFEAKHALVADNKGLMFYERISELTEDLLKPNGLLVMEFGRGQDEEVRELFKDKLEALEIHKDLSGLPRFLTGRTARGL